MTDKLATVVEAVPFAVIRKALEEVGYDHCGVEEGWHKFARRWDSIGLLIPTADGLVVGEDLKGVREIIRDEQRAQGRKHPTRATGSAA